MEQKYRAQDTVSLSGPETGLRFGVGCATKMLEFSALGSSQAWGSCRATVCLVYEPVL